MFWSRFRVFTVHIDPKRAAPYESAMFVEEGFSFRAFILSFIWTLYHRLWWASFVIIVGNIIIFQLGENGTVSHAGNAVLQLGFSLFIGYMANDWLRAKLTRRGFTMTDIVTGDSPARAEQRFYDRYFGHSLAPIA